MYNNNVKGGEGSSIKKSIIYEKPPPGRLSSASAVVLAGGEGRRMGAYKGLVTVRGRPLVILVAESLGELFEEVFIFGEGAAGRDAYGFTGLRVVPDRLSQEWNPSWGSPPPSRRPVTKLFS